MKYHLTKCSTCKSTMLCSKPACDRKTHGCYACANKVTVKNAATAKS